MNLILSGHLFPLFPFFVFRVNASRRLPQASARRLPFGHPRICSQITGDSALQCWSGCEISPRVHHFYSRPCGRGDGTYRRGNAQGAHFYSRPCGRGDDPGANREIRTDAISTHAPAGGATVALSANALREVFLLTPLREGRLGQRCVHAELVFISTHAPAGGATSH